MKFQNGNIHQNILFIQPVHDWKVDVVSRFFELLYSQKVRYGGQDTICWVPLKKKSYYQVLSTLVWSTFPYKNIWKVKAPPRVALCVWMATLRKILTLAHLHKRNIIVLEWYCMSKNCRVIL